jgi:hypothetical protein
MRAESICVGLLASLAVLVSGCVPVPYKPEATVSHTRIDVDTASHLLVSSRAQDGMPGPIGRAIRRAEPRVVLLQPGAADYVLCVGRPVVRQLHDTGAAAPFPYLPVIWVGYEKVQSHASLTAALIDVRDPQAAEGFLVDSDYSETIAALVYGVATAARPQAALQQALGREVAHELAVAHPTGAIRLTIVRQMAPPAAASGGDTRPRAP